MVSYMISIQSLWRCIFGCGDQRSVVNQNHAKQILIAAKGALEQGHGPAALERK